MQGTSLDGTTLRELVRGKARPGTRAVITARFRLVLLAIACVAMAVGLAVFLVLREAAERRAEIKRDAETAAFSLADGIDRELATAGALLTGLTVSHGLITGDLAAFHRQAIEALKPPGSWIVLFDPQGRQLANTLRPYGKLLPEMSDSAKRDISEIARTGRERVSDLFYAPLLGGNAVGLAIPVFHEDVVVYVLAITINPSTLARIASQQRLPAGWSATILDRLGATITRYPAETHEFDRADPVALLSEIGHAGDTSFETAVPEHGHIFLAHSQSKLAGWTSVVAVPGAVVDAPMHRAAMLVGGGGGVLLVLAAGMALFTGSRIDRPFRERMQASEERFRVMAETVPSILFTCSPDGQCEYANQRFYDYTGMAPGSALGYGWATALHPDDEQRAFERLKQPTGDGDLILSEVRIRAMDGTYRWFLGRLRPVRDPGGRIIKWFGSSSDIDDLKQSDATLRRINERLIAVLCSINECYYTVDHHWRITYVNPNAATYFRDDPAHLVGRTLWEVSPHVIGTELERQLRKALDEHTPLHVERMSREYFGRWFQISCYPWAEGLSIFFSDITRRKTAELAVRDTQELLQLTMDALSAHIAILDEHGVVIAVNAAWRRFAEETGFRDTSHGVGSDYFAVCAATIPRSAEAEQAAKGIEALLQTERREFRMDYACPGPDGSRWFQIRATRFGEEGARRVVIAREDISEIKEAENGLRELAGRLLRLQDEERRRMARDLHDTTAQNLVAAILDIDRLHQAAPALNEISEELLGEARALVEQSLQEIRTLSYLLHPPLLDELGLASALSWYVRGFESRSGITVALDVREGMERLPAAVENALFRVVQEALTNIHRHSDSATAEIRLARSATEVVLEVADQGRGIPAEAGSEHGVLSLGVGVSGMRARLHQLGGELIIRATGQGTTVRATVSVDRLPSAPAAP